MKPSRIVWSSLAMILLWAGYLAYRAHTNLVTLNVRNMDVRRVISKLEWQTWERIILNKNVGGHVTLNVRKVPLEEVLNIVALQTGSRWMALYPIYSTRRSASKFAKVVRGDLAPDGSGWLNLQKSGLWQWKGLSGFASVLRSENKLVSAQFMEKDLDFAALALSRFSQAQVVPEDNIKGVINLKLEQVPFAKAVAQVAKQVHRKWKQIYAIQPLNGPVVVQKDVANPAGTPPPERPAAPPPMPVMREQTENPPERLQEAFLATMTPQERQRAQEQLAAMQQLQSLPPAERQQRMQEMSSQMKQASESDTLRRIQLRLKNGTPDQRVAHDRRELQKKQGEPKR